MCTATSRISTSSRMPVIPTGSAMPPCLSTVYSCGIGTSSSCSSPRLTDSATSWTRRISCGLISSPATDTRPVVSWVRTFSVAIPQWTGGAFTPAMRSASLSALAMERVVSSMSRITPRRTPVVRASPTPRIRASTRRPSPATSATTAHVLVLPTSRPATNTSRFMPGSAAPRSSRRTAHPARRTGLRRVEGAAERSRWRGPGRQWGRW